MIRKLRLLVPAALLSLGGCASHYLVRDPATGNTYFTKDVDRTGDSGSVNFKDSVTGARIIIQQSEVRMISEDEYEAGIGRGK